MSRLKLVLDGPLSFSEVAENGFASLAFLRSVLSYDPVTGAFLWTIDQKYGRSKGSVATRHHGDGYLAIGIGKRIIQAHRAAWALTYDVVSFARIDHENRIRHDNRIANLREAGSWQNQANNPKCKNNTSGYRGVSYQDRYGTFRARLAFDTRNIDLGCFRTAEEAAVAYDLAALHFRGEYAGQLNFPDVHRFAAKLAKDAFSPSSISAAAKPAGSISFVPIAPFTRCLP